ncbi:MAG TPA: gluconokinase [Steroidobacteraceae bacterium]|nr:gluconokinase [Steroidobacteraceae bacterium]
MTIAADSAIRSYVVMGVAGAGKSAVGAALADALGMAFVEGDAYHAPTNVQRMAAGIPLTDADRLPWLQALAARLRESGETGAVLVMACSALKRSYRDMLRAGAANLTFIYLHGDRELLAARLAQRLEHFMPPSLLESQLAALEPPAPEENAWAYNVRLAPREIVATVLERIAAQGEAMRGQDV